MTYDELVKQVHALEPAVEDGKMFGMRVMKINGKVIGGEWHGDATFKLAESDVPAALEIEGAGPFSPMQGRPMKRWVLVPASQSSLWLRLAGQALEAREQAGN
jgi:hypothetical protein